MATPPDILGALRKLEDNLVDRLTIEMDRRFAESRLEVNARFDAIEARLEKLETEHQMILAALRRMEEAIAEDRAERAKLKTGLAELRQKVAELDAHVRMLEARLEDES
jgi:chromosome segregation ATPase